MSRCLVQLSSAVCADRGASPRASTHAGQSSCTCFWTPSVISTWLRRQLTHMLDGLLAMGTPHRQQSLRRQQLICGGCNVMHVPTSRAVEKAMTVAKQEAGLNIQGAGGRVLCMHTT